MLINCDQWENIEQINIILSETEMKIINDRNFGHENKNTNYVYNDVWDCENLSDHRPVITNLTPTQEPTPSKRKEEETLNIKNIKSKFTIDWENKKHIDIYKSEIESILLEQKLDNNLKNVSMENAETVLANTIHKLNKALLQAKQNTVDKITQERRKPSYLIKLEAKKSKSWWNHELTKIVQLKKSYYDNNKSILQTSSLAIEENS